MNAYRLVDLKPAWLPTESATERWRTGIKFRCPLCPEHNLVFWFANPADKGEAMPEKALFWMPDGSAFHDLTLAQEGSTVGDPACFDRSDHGRVWVVEGEVYIAPAEPKPDRRVAVPLAQCDA
jgi:hypothetical protein